MTPCPVSGTGSQEQWEEAEGWEVEAEVRVSAQMGCCLLSDGVSVSLTVSSSSVKLPVVAPSHFILFIYDSVVLGVEFRASIC